MLTSRPFMLGYLPPLVWGELPEISFAELVEVGDETFSVRESDGFRLVRRLADMDNLIAYWRGQIAQEAFEESEAASLEFFFDPRGNLDRKELEEALVEAENLPEFVQEFLDRYPSDQERLRFHGELVASFFRRASEQTKGFLHDYFSFEREWRLVMVVLRAHELKRAGQEVDIGRELQWEDPTEPFIADLLAQKDSEQIEPPEEYIDLKVMIEEQVKEGSDPWALAEHIEAFRFRRVGEMVEGMVFEWDRILAYMVQLMVLEAWQAHLKQKELEQG